jgi:hypothetical protein
MIIPDSNIINATSSSYLLTLGPFKSDWGAPPSSLFKETAYG